MQFEVRVSYKKGFKGKQSFVVEFPSVAEADAWAAGKVQEPGFSTIRIDCMPYDGCLHFHHKKEGK